MNWKKRIRIIHWKSKLILFSVSLAGGVYLTLAVYVGSYTGLDTAAPADAVLVLGAKAYRGKDFNPCLVERVKQGIKLLDQGFAPKIIFTGGDDSEDHSNEAEVMKQIALKNGVSDDQIILETKATSTYENLSNTQKILKEQNLNSIILVTEPFHMARASLVAQKLNIKHHNSPAEKSVCWSRWKFLSRYFLKEPFAIISYKFSGKL